MTGRNISDYLIKTSKEYYKRRYGGFEFGIHNPLKSANLTSIQKNLQLILKKIPLPDSIIDSPSLGAEVLTGYLDDVIKSKMDNVRVWFNNKGWTSSVGYLNAVNNLILRASVEAQADDLDSDDFLGFKDPHEFGISIISHPMNFTEKQLNEKNM